MLVYMTLKPEKVVFGLDQETVREDSVTLLKTISVAGSGPGETKQGRFFYSETRTVLIISMVEVEILCRNYSFDYL